jgi:hypothetical protein
MFLDLKDKKSTLCTFGIQLQLAIVMRLTSPAHIELSQSSPDPWWYQAEKMISSKLLSKTRFLLSLKNDMWH